jgi:hypothetical protein
LIHTPSGTERVRCSVLMRDGINFSNQLIGSHHKRIGVWVPVFTYLPIDGE